MTAPLIYPVETFWLSQSGWEMSDDGDSVTVPVRAKASAGPADEVPLQFPFAGYQVTLFTADGARGPSICRMESRLGGPLYYVAGMSRTLQEFAALFDDDQPDQ